MSPWSAAYGLKVQLDDRVFRANSAVTKKKKGSVVESKFLPHAAAPVPRLKP